HPRLPLRIACKPGGIAPKAEERGHVPMRPRWILFSGGGGGAKLALGLARVLAPNELLVVGNTGDDFEHVGLRISPDLDSLMYTLAGVVSPITGWGRAD